MTWFNHQHDFPKLNLSLFSDPEKSLAEALRLLKAPGPQQGSGILI